MVLIFPEKSYSENSKMICLEKKNINKQSIFKVTAKPDTKLMYETPLFVGQGTPSDQRFDWQSLRRYTYPTPLLI
jgi:hypothetical protein